MFRVIPAVDIKDGKVVRLRQGRENEITFEAENPVRVAKNWIEKGAKVLHVIDLDGAFQGKLRHEREIREIISLGAEVHVGGGIRSLDLAEKLLNFGARRVILGTIAFERVGEVRKFAERWKDRVIIAIDTKQGKVAVRGWKEKTEITPLEFARIYEDCEVSFLYTNIDIEGLAMGINRENLEFLRKIKRPFYVAGGISSIEDILFIKKLGARGAILGSALYMGKIKLEEALRLEHEES
ncbi:MAG: 1-(5-phosphoribosyl)-5-[(5-phosphoribosylamino)methylideneamino]imidazole-4-carboxamide isomerase [Archaeoglobales archaeon]|jgi:phosphoribosylformimino-5-aminoimidazole carboxamide ribotide isomerase|nr:1-(5-phosphoribosyl)-5-[(5-phosphoribosylamino)methylideneamino]imidazole-4-carboxamide isomerase [Archaeoglobus sp.]NHW89371.1 1-(5-phosphoribosyl)-5-[(5-phosphoribosylamino)methylideneamino]imidazole-4-carboxamide isomerase [Archaeoglobales archaeon]TDA27836.1 MAG: 1-(5-phosphoribosyl)-5-((5-phosphoribosylamino)methylideneamino)imidazole-4-carboxamide isomerase [Archaeoglobi archaeon]